MLKLPLLSWIGNAAAVLCGKRGAITTQAEEAGCSRQTAYDHADKVLQAVEDSRLPGPSRQQLLTEVAQLRDENRQLWDWLEQTIDCPLDKQQQFTVTATAMGLSLTQILTLLAILLPASRLPSRASLGRWVNRSAKRAGQLLAVLDKACRSLVLSLCLDEIFFHRKPVLMGIEPRSLAWVLGQRAADRCGDTWAKALAGWPNVKDVACDGGTGLERGLQLAAQQRQQAAEQPGNTQPAVPIRSRLDTFHIKRDGSRALRQEWARAEALWDEAEKIERAKRRYNRTGRDRRRFNQAKVDKAWAKAVASFEVVCGKEKAWQRAQAALNVLRPDGELNTRQWAEAEIRAALTELGGPPWAKVRRQLQDERALTFLDRMHEELLKAEPCADRREMLVVLWRWRRQRQKEQAGKEGVAQEVEEVLAAVLRARLGEDWKEAYRRVSRVLGGVLRASSAVECVNSVVRMHQARHRNLTQELLDLKRLFWNCRTFREGKRKKHCPYQLLGLNLPTYDPWLLLQMDPAHLIQLLSSSGFTV
jgi:hypothetical protein